MADEEKGLSVAVDTASDTEDTETSSEEEEESFEEYESGADEAAGEPAAVKPDAAQVCKHPASRLLNYHAFLITSYCANALLPCDFKKAPLCLRVANINRNSVMVIIIIASNCYARETLLFSIMFVCR